MSNMHEHDTERLSEYIDGELTAQEQATLEAHLTVCRECRDVLEDLRAIAGAATRLPGSLPDRELWPGLASRIEADAAGARTRVAQLQPRAKRRFSFTMPQLAAAALLLMAMSAGLVYLAMPGEAPVEVTSIDAGAPADGGLTLVGLADPQYDGAVADLERTLHEGRDRLDPETVRVLEENLETIDAAIEQSRRALETDPANSFLNNHLVSARQRKLALLRRATALTTGS